MPTAKSKIEIISQIRRSRNALLS